MLLALGASVSVVGPSSKRTIALDKFFTLPADGNLRRENVLQNDEIITEVQVPASKFAANSTYLKFKERDSMDFAMSAVAAAVAMGANKTVADARIVLGACSNIQDNSLLLTDSVRGDLVIGERVTFGHNVRMSSGEIGDDALVGMMAIVGEHVVVERGGCIAAGAWVEPGTVVRAGWIWAGRPARAFREVKPQEREIFARGVDVYVGYGRAYLAAAG